MTPKMIKTAKEYSAAMARAEVIFDARPRTPEGDELELLLLLIEKYEEKAFPIDLPDPVTAIRFRMDQQGLKQNDLEPYLGSKSKVSEVLSGRRELSLTMMRKLVNGLGIPAEVLLREPGANLPASEIVEFGRRFPLAQMLKRGWFNEFSGSLGDLKDQLEDVLTRFAAPVQGCCVVPALNRQRVRDGGTTDAAALAAWRIRVVSQACRESLPAYRRGSVTKKYMDDIVRLSYLDDGPKLAREFLNKRGIHLIIERHLSRTFLDGAALVMPDGSRLVALTLRHDRLDNFWFTLLHELAHISLHLDRQHDVDAIFDDLDSRSTDIWEKEADALASETLIPGKAWKNSGLNKDYSETSVKAFAEKLRIHPSIVAGRIRFENSNYRLLSDMVGHGVVRKAFEASSLTPTAPSRATSDSGSSRPPTARPSPAASTPRARRPSSCSMRPARSR